MKLLHIYNNLDEKTSYGFLYIKKTVMSFIQFLDKRKYLPAYLKIIIDNLFKK